MKFNIESMENLERALREILKKVPPGSAFTLSGHPGAGKTTLVKTAAKLLGVKENVQSPTFNLLNIYRGSLENGEPVEIFHYDFYRLKKGDPLGDLVLPEHDRNLYVFMEWPERINPSEILANIEVYALTIETKYSLEKNEVTERTLIADL